MSRRLHPLAVLVLALLPLASCHLNRPPTPIGVPGFAHASYALGWKDKESSWGRADDELVFGVVDFDSRLEARGMWFVGKALVGTAGEPDYVADPDADSSGTAEFDFGLRTYTSLGPLEPFVSGGLALLTGSITGHDGGYYDSYSRNIDSAVTVGAWVDAGFFLPVTPSWGVGLAVHVSHGPEQDLEGVDVQLGGVSVLFLIGGRW